MKALNKYIVEKLKISKKQKTEYTLFPETRDALVQMIIKEIKQNGEECSLNHIDVSKITDLDKIFWYTETMHFNGDISEWDVSNAESMEGLFEYSDFEGDISEWDVSKVKNMAMMFYGAAFDGDLSRWDVSNVENMEFMFNHSMYSGRNGNISRWDVSKVLNMEQMFFNSDFNQDISNWKINKKCEVYNMFEKCPIKKEYKPF
jgi:hypothetical protein